jgi:polyhydroxybutyrate depolymerase
MTRFLTILMMCLLPMLSALADGTPGEPREIRLRHGRLDRSYWVYVPRSYTGERAVPLLMALHGSLQDPKGLMKQADFNTIAEREGFIAVYPAADFLRWDAFQDGPNDDVGFLLTVLDDVGRMFNADPDRVYLTGASNGGYMAFTLAFRAPGQFAALAPVISYMPEFLTEVGYPKDSPLPVCLVTGTGDPIVPYLAKEVPGGLFKRYPTLNAPETLAWWVQHNRCEPEPEVVDLPVRFPDDKTRVTRIRYTGKHPRAEILHYRVVGGGHGWPGSDAGTIEFLTGPLSKEFSAVEAIWAFFARHSLSDR